MLLEKNSADSDFPIPSREAVKSFLESKPQRIRLYPIPLRRFFPPDDDFATTVARLLILREDLFLEIYGIVNDPIPALDKNTAAWRHNYFFRNSVRTLMEIASAIHTLNGLSAFKQAMGRYPKDLLQYFKAFCQRIENAHDLIREVRNTIGGHVKHRAVERALKVIDWERRGFWEKTDYASGFIHTHHPFVNELFIAVLQGGERPEDVPKKDVNEVLEITGVMAKLTEAIPVIDLIFRIYIRDRQLL